MSGAIDWALVAARFATFSLAIALFGWAVFDARTPERRPLRRAAALAPAALALAALAYLVLLAREAAAAPGWPPPGVLAQVAFLVGFGRALGVTLAAALALVALTARGAGAPRARLALSGLALASLAFVGHAADGTGLRGVLRLAVMAAHQLAVGAWLGALAPLAAALVRDPPGAPETLRRFGGLAIVSVFVVLGAGLCSLAFVIADVHGAVGPTYLKALGVKLAVVVALLAVAAVNRWWLTPLAERNPERAVRRLRLTIALEQLLGLAAIAAVAVLGQLDPGM